MAVHWPRFLNKLAECATIAPQPPALPGITNCLDLAPRMMHKNCWMWEKILIRPDVCALTLRLPKSLQFWITVCKCLWQQWFPFPKIEHPTENCQWIFVSVALKVYGLLIHCHSIHIQCVCFCISILCLLSYLQRHFIDGKFSDCRLLFPFVMTL